MILFNIYCKFTDIASLSSDLLGGDPSTGEVNSAGELASDDGKEGCEVWGYGSCEIGSVELYLSALNEASFDELVLEGGFHARVEKLKLGVLRVVDQLKRFLGVEQ